jgi:hypothetical protein
LCSLCTIESSIILCWTLSPVWSIFIINNVTGVGYTPIRLLVGIKHFYCFNF